MRKILALMLIFSLTLCGLSFPVSADSTDQLIQYPTYPEELSRDYDYEVTVTQGDKSITLPVYNAVRKENNYSGVENTDSYRRFCEFAFSGEVTVSVKSRLPIDSYALLPSSKGYTSTISGDTITFTLTDPADIVLRLNEDNNTILAIFAEAPETDVPSETDENVMYFKAGCNNLSEHSKVKWTLDEDGIMHIPANTTIYLEPGALVSSRMRTRYNNVKIYGRGAFIDSRMDRNGGDYSYMFAAQPLSGVDYISNFHIEGVRFLDAHTFNLCFTNVKDVTVKGVKLLSNQISTDGISFWSRIADNVLIENVFMHITDNAFVNSCATNITVKDCIVGTDYGIFYPQGNIQNITFDGIDLFRCGNFFRATMTTTAERKWDNFVIRNLHAEDALDMSAFIYLTGQSAGGKYITMENLSLPATHARVYINNCKDLFFTINNVFFGGQKVSGAELFTSDTTISSNSSVKFTFGEDFDASKAGVGVYSSSIVDADYEGAIRVEVGGQTLKNAAVVSTLIDETPYVPAPQTLEALGFKLSYDENSLVFGDANGIYHLYNNSAVAKQNGIATHITNPMKVVDGTPMLPMSAFEKLLGLKTSFADNTVTIENIARGENLLEDSGFEKIINEALLNDPDAAKQGYLTKSHEWITFNFAPFFGMTDAASVRSGSSALRVVKSSTQTAVGASQSLIDDIQRYGAGTYRFEVWAKLGQNQNPLKKDVYMGLVQAGYRYYGDDGNLIGINDIKSFTLTDEWQKLTYDITITNPAADGYDRAFFFIGSALRQSGDGTEVDFLVDDVSVTYLGDIDAPETPEYINGEVLKALSAKSGIMPYYTRLRKGFEVYDLDISTVKAELEEMGMTDIEMGTILATPTLAFKGKLVTSDDIQNGDAVDLKGKGIIALGGTSSDPNFAARTYLSFVDTNGEKQVIYGEQTVCNLF